MSKKILKLMSLCLIASTMFFSGLVHAKAYIDMPKYEYDSDQRIKVKVAKMSSKKAYWLGIYPKSKGSNWRNVISWPKQRLRNGMIKMEKIYRPGSYVAKLFYKDSYRLVDSVEFDIVSAQDNDCGTPWYKASLTHYESYPAPGSEECQQYNGCKWKGQFYGIKKKKSKRWVKNHNIVAVHLKDWDWLGNRKLRIRKGNKEIMVTAYDACSDSDDQSGNDACTRNLGNNDFLIDMEKFTKRRFGSGSGTVKFQVCY